MGALFTIFAAEQQAEAIRGLSEFEATQQESNADSYAAAGADALRRGEAEAAVAAMKAGLLRGEQRVAYAASGVDLSEGTPVDVMAASAAMSAMDIGTIRANAAREAWGFQTQAYQQRKQAQYTRKAGRAKAEATILGGLASSFDQGIGTAASLAAL